MVFSRCTTWSHRCSHYGCCCCNRASARFRKTTTTSNYAGNQAPRRSNTWRRDAAPPARAAPYNVAPPPRQPPPPNPPRHQSNDRQHRFTVCYHCRSLKHFHRYYNASPKKIKAYKTYKKFLNAETNYAHEEVMVEANNAHHVDPSQAPPQTFDAPDFD